MTQTININQKKIDKDNELLMSVFQAGTNNFIKVVNYWRICAKRSHPEKSQEIENILKGCGAKLQFSLEINLDTRRPFVTATVLKNDGEKIFLFTLDGKNDD